MLLYVIDTNERWATRSNVNKREVESISLDDYQTFHNEVTHFELGFKQDNITVWNKLKDLLLNSPPYNHITEFNATRDGCQAWNTLTEFYEGEDFMERNRDRAFSKLNNTFYKGETNRYNFEKYINTHKEAHKMLQDAG